MSATPYARGEEAERALEGVWQGHYHIPGGKLRLSFVSRGKGRGEEYTHSVYGAGCA